MRISYYNVGRISTFIYFLSTFIAGMIFMIREGDKARTAGKEVDEANELYNAANAEVLNNEARLTTAQNTITNANCYVNGYSAFVDRLNTYCASSVATTNQQSLLSSSYGLQFIIQGPKTEKTTRTDWEWVLDGCERTVNKCDKNGNNCKKEKEKEKYSCYKLYDVTVVVIYNYGTMVNGSGSKYFLGCAQYDHGVTIGSETWHKTTTDVSKTKYYETETRNYASKASAFITVDSQPKSETASTYEVFTNTTDFQQPASNILGVIHNQCESLNNALKSPAHYVTIAANTQATMPAIQDDITRTKQVREKAAAYRDGKQKIFDSADGDYRHELSFWLPLIFVPTAAFSGILVCFKEALKQKNFDTQECCSASVKDAIPIAIPAKLYGFRSNRNGNTSTTPQDQTQSINVDIESTAGFNSDDQQNKSANILNEEYFDFTQQEPPAATIVEPPSLSANMDYDDSETKMSYGKQLTIA